MARLWFDYHKSYFCRDCVYCFTIHNKMGRGKRIHCPSCGDSIAVEPFEPPTKQYDGRNRFWSAEELELIDQLNKGEMLIYQVAIKTGRTPKAVRNRLSQWRKGRKE